MCLVKLLLKINSDLPASKTFFVYSNELPDCLPLISNFTQPFIFIIHNKQRSRCTWNVVAHCKAEVSSLAFCLFWISIMLFVVDSQIYQSRLGPYYAMFGKILNNVYCLMANTSTILYLRWMLYSIVYNYYTKFYTSAILYNRPSNKILFILPTHGSPDYTII